MLFKSTHTATFTTDVRCRLALRDTLCVAGRMQRTMGMPLLGQQQLLLLAAAVIAALLSCRPSCAQFGDGISGLPEQGNPVLADAPSQRVGHTLTPVSKDKFILFGGDNSTYMWFQDTPVKLLNDMKILNLALDGEATTLYRGQWIDTAISGDFPSPRHGHSASVLKIDVKRSGKAKKSEKQIIYFGGATGGNQESVSNEIFRFDIGGLKWHKIEAEGGPKRMYHTAAPISSATHAPIVVFGGLDETYSPTNDVYTFDYRSKKWAKMEVSGPAPPPRWRHSAVLHDKKMYVSGGDASSFGSGATPLRDFWILDLTEWTWRYLEIPSKLRSARMGHTSFHTVVSEDLYMRPDEAEGKEFEKYDMIYMMGGFGYVSATDNMMENPESIAFVVKNETFFELMIASQLPYGSLYWGQAGVKTENTILLMGGMEHLKLSNKAWELELTRMEIVEFDSDDLPQLEMSDEGKWEPVEGEDTDAEDSEDEGAATHDEL